MNAGCRAKDFFGGNDALSQKMFAQRLQVSDSAFSNYLNGKRTMPYEVITAIAAEFDTTTDYLLGLTDIKGKPFTPNEAEYTLLNAFRALTPAQRDFIVQSIKIMSAQNTQVPLPTGA